MLIEENVKLITFIRDMMKTVWLFSITGLQTYQFTTIQALPQCSSDSFVYYIGRATDTQNHLTVPLCAM